MSECWIPQHIEFGSVGQHDYKFLMRLRVCVEKYEGDKYPEALRLILKNSLFVSTNLCFVLPQNVCHVSPYNCCSHFIGYEK